jgi:hypothetical protein
MKKNEIQLFGRPKKREAESQQRINRFNFFYTASDNGQ